MHIQLLVIKVCFYGTQCSQQHWMMSIMISNSNYGHFVTSGVGQGSATILQPCASRPGFAEVEARTAMGFGEARATTHTSSYE